MRRVAFALAAGALAACGHTETHEVVLRAPPGPHGRTVEIYMVSQTPPRPYYEIAILQAIGDGSEANLEDIVKSMTRRAGELGCDAVVRVQIDMGYSRGHATGICAKYSEPASAPAAAPTPAPAPAPAPAPTAEPDDDGARSL